MKILVIGSNGQVGSELRAALVSRFLGSKTANSVIFFDRSNLDLTHLSRIAAELRQVAPDVIVNASAYTAVDKAETEYEVAFDVNENAVREIAKYCHTAECTLVHLSTDYVFDGGSGSPYREEDTVGALGVYGRSKLAGETAIREILSRHIILRTSWVFSANGSNFVKTMLKLGEVRPEISVVVDQLGSPTSARSIAQAIGEILTMLENSDARDALWGTYHFSGLPYVSWADFASEIFDQAVKYGLMKYRPVVKEIPSSEYPTPSARPSNSRLDCSKLKAYFGIEPDDWRISLSEVLCELKEAR